jgi:hypothetical protein
MMFSAKVHKFLLEKTMKLVPLSTLELSRINPVVALVKDMQIMELVVKVDLLFQERKKIGTKAPRRTLPEVLKTRRVSILTGLTLILKRQEKSSSDTSWRMSKH